MTKTREIYRRYDDESGDINCLRCGKPIHLRFNGGELDERGCCGLLYTLEHVQIDLVVYEYYEEVADV